MPTQHTLKSLWQEEDGVTAIEYALIASLICGVISFSVWMVGQSTADLWAKVQNCVSYAVGNGSACA